SAPGYYFQMARTYAALQNYDAAQQMLRKAIEICPNNSAYWAKLGEVLRASGAADQAREAYREALAYQPTNYEARDILRELEGKKSVFSYFPEANIGELVKAS
ncbi:MAG: tetratricopeptide repeat protein, partial [Calditrichaeota bacterium]|nr:tetratricopeptide repeat protein [Calditrichota bacterium]